MPRKRRRYSSVRQAFAAGYRIGRHDCLLFSGWALYFVALCALLILLLGHGIALCNPPWLADFVAALTLQHLIVRWELTNRLLLGLTGIFVETVVPVVVGLCLLYSLVRACRGATPATALLRSSAVVLAFPVTVVEAVLEFFKCLHPAPDDLLKPLPEPEPVSSEPQQESWTPSPPASPPPDSGGGE